MVNHMNEHKRDLGVRWIQAESGTSYLCPISALEDLEQPTDEKLKEICIDESMNP